MRPPGEAPVCFKHVAAPRVCKIEKLVSSSRKSWLSDRSWATSLRRAAKEALDSCLVGLEKSLGQSLRSGRGAGAANGGARVSACILSRRMASGRLGTPGNRDGSCRSRELVGLPSATDQLAGSSFVGASFINLGLRGCAERNHARRAPMEAVITRYRVNVLSKIGPRLDSMNS